MVSKTLFSSLTPEWPTPQALFDELHDEFHFTIDVAATKENTKLPRYYDEATNGLAQDWSGERVWCNPPYGRAIGDWVAKAHESSCLAVLLLPARTDTRWMHDHILGHADIRFVKGRLKFGDATNSAPFPSMIAIWKS